MVFVRNTFRATVVVCLVLAASFLLTGLASSVYHRERISLAQTHFTEGQRLTSSGKLEQAVDEYRKALLFTPYNTAYRLSLATALIDNGRLDEAESHLEQLVQQEPTNSRVNWMLGRIAAQRGRLKDAIDYYQRAVYEYWPPSQAADRRAARWELIGILKQAGERTAVVAELIQLYANAPPDPNLKVKIGFMLLDNGANSEGSQVFRDLVKTDPQNAQAYLGLAEVYFGYGDFMSARHELQRALHFDPANKEIVARLQSTNDVIEMDPGLPRITSAERLRRSQNLLTRVMKDLELCSGLTPAPAQATSPVGKPASNPPAAPQPAANPLQASLDAAQTLLTTKQTTADLALEMQNAAEQLWRNKEQFCKQNALEDPLVSGVVARLGT